MNIDRKKYKVIETELQLINNDKKLKTQLLIDIWHMYHA